jgi:dolichol-phosphate mannosyltransferase
VGLHFAILAVLLQAASVSFTVGQTSATLATMVFNFWLNNVLTYRDRQLHGWRWWRGLLSFVLACSVGALANVGIASYLFENEARWFTAAFAGVLVGAVWNYAVTQLYTWGKSR